MLAKSIIKDPLGLRYYSVAVSYAVLAWLAGFAGLFSSNWFVNIAATIAAIAPLAPPRSTSWSCAKKSGTVANA